MHLATYRFHGDPETLTAAYHRLTASLPPDTVALNLAVEVPDGLLVIDTCPTEADFRASSISEEFAAALIAAGLPTPTVESMGSVVGATGTQVGALT